MSAADDLVAALDQGSFESALEGAMGGLDKGGLKKLMDEMNAKAAGIPDHDKRHLYKNGIASVQMTMDSM